MLGTHPVGELMKLVGKFNTFPAVSPDMELYYITEWIEGLTGDILSVNYALKQGSTEMVAVYSWLR